MEVRKGFYDLCVPYQQNEKEFIAILNELYEGKYFMNEKCKTIKFLFVFSSSFSWL